MSNRLAGIVPTNSGLDIFQDPSFSTDEDFTTSSDFAQLTGGTAGQCTWDMGASYYIDKLIIKCSYIIYGIGSITLERSLDNTNWFTVFTTTSGTTNNIFNYGINTNVRYFRATLLSTIQSVVFVIDEIMTSNPNRFIVQDTTDDYSLSEHNSWGVQVGLPLPKALRAWK